MYDWWLVTDDNTFCIWYQMNNSSPSCHQNSPTKCARCLTKLQRQSDRSNAAVAGVTDSCSSYSLPNLSALPMRKGSTLPLILLISSYIEKKQLWPRTEQFKSWYISPRLSSGMPFWTRVPIFDELYAWNHWQLSLWHKIILEIQEQQFIITNTLSFYR